MKKLITSIIAIAVTIAAPLYLFAQAGSVDRSFNTFGSIPYGNGQGLTMEANTILKLPDGKILIGGSITDYNGTALFGIARLNQDGTLDTTFKTGRGFRDGNNNAPGQVENMLLQPDGKILVCGNFSYYNDSLRQKIARLNSDGTLDHTFNTGNPLINGDIVSMGLQSDGKIIVSGNFQIYQGTPRARIARLNTDGTLDLTFSGRMNSAANKILVQNDDKVVVIGYFTSVNDTSRNHIARFNANGVLDANYNPGSSINSTITDMKFDASGNIIIAGFFDFTVNVYRVKFITKITSSGFFDYSYNGSNWLNASSGGILSFDTLANGKIIAAGTFTTPRNGIMILSNTGALQTTFNVPTGVSGNYSLVKVVEPNRILVSGQFTNPGDGRGNLLAIDTLGTIDVVYNPEPGFSAFVRSIDLQNDGKLICGGAFARYMSNTVNRLIRLNTNGSRDNTFNTGSGFDNVVRAVKVLSDGKIIVGGEFTSFNGTTVNRIVRLNANGSIDNSFNVGTGLNGTVRCIAVQSDGKILVGGDFTNYKGTGINRIVRINTNGDIDATFSVGSGFNSRVQIITVQSNGKILVGGDFTTYDGTAQGRIIRLNTDGSRDNNFNVGNGFNNMVFALTLLSDGKILAGGSFTNYKDTLRNYIVRINSDGTIDPTFSIGTGFNNTVVAIKTQTGGKAIVIGDFWQYNGSSANKIARINTNGTIDNTFISGSGFDIGPLDLAIQNDQQILVAGTFSLYNGVYSNRIVRINSDCIINKAVSVSGNTITAAQTGATYQWVDCNNNYAPLSGETGQTLTTTTPGRYAVIITRGSGCVDTSNCAQITATGIDEVFNAHQFVYPNPATNELNIGKVSNGTTISIHDITGRIVAQEIAGATSHTINTSMLNDGIYLVKFEYNNQLHTVKVVINK